MNIDKNKSYRTHLEVLKECFDVELECHRWGAYKLNDHEMVWFPDATNEQWGNAVELNYRAIWERVPNNAKKEMCERVRDFTRLVFMKFEDGYKYLGVYEFDYDKSVDGCNIYKRVFE